MSENENTPDNGAELVELEQPPAPPHEGAPAGAGDRQPPAPAPDVNDPDELDEDLDELDGSHPSRHESSAGFGIVGKFTGARADRQAQRTERQLDDEAGK